MQASGLTEAAADAGKASVLQQVAGEIKDMLTCLICAVRAAMHVCMLYVESSSDHGTVPE